MHWEGVRADYHVFPPLVVKIRALKQSHFIEKPFKIVVRGLYFVAVSPCR